MLTEDEIAVLGVLTTPLVAIVSFAVGRFVSYREDKRKAAKERLDNFFNPFISLLFRTTKGRALNFTDLPNEVQIEFVDFLLDKQVYSSNNIMVKVQEIVQPYAYITFNKDESLEQATASLNKKFNELVDCVYSEWDGLRGKFYR